MSSPVELPYIAEFIAFAQKHGWHAHPIADRRGVGVRAHKTVNGRGVEILTVEWTLAGEFAHGMHTGVSRHGCRVTGIEQARQIIARPREHYALGSGRGHEAV